MRIAAKVGAGVGALALAVIPAVQASADAQAGPNDVVGVGSDTVQYIGDFLFDGDYASDAGFNSSNTYKVFNYDATDDAFGAASYTSTGAINYGAGVVLRRGTKPVVLPHDSGSGATALVGDTATPSVINFSRASSLQSNSTVPLHDYKVATDSVEIASEGTGSNASASLSATQLASIYTATGSASSPCKTWNQIDPSNPSTDVIKAVIPDSTSGTTKNFLTGVGITFSQVGLPGGGNPGCVTLVQEHDPSPFLGQADVIGPFASSRYNLLQTGYFSAAGFNAGAITLLGDASGTGATSNGSFSFSRGLYFVVRQSDVVATGGWQPGTTKNIVNTLFGPGTGALHTGGGFVTTAVAKKEIAAAGATYSYVDCGINPTSC